MWSRLLSWWRGRRLGHLRVVMYTRRGCHLCEVAWQRLEEARQRYGFALTAEDVDADPDLAAGYGDCVPVVTVNGKVYFRGAVNPVLLERLLRAEAPQRYRNCVDAGQQARLAAISQQRLPLPRNVFGQFSCLKPDTNDVNRLINGDKALLGQDLPLLKAQFDVSRSARVS